MDMHTHFLRDDTRLMTFVAMRTAVGKAGWNKALADKEQTIEDLKFANYIKEIFLDSDTKIALISSAPSDIEQDWFLTNEQMAAARDKVNKEAGSRRMFAHMIFTPGQPGWLEKLEAGLALKPESVQGLHDRRQHPQGHQPVSLAHGRREGRLQGLREDGEGGHQERLHPQGPVPARRRKAVPAPARLRRRRRCRAGRERLAAAQLHHLPLGLSPRRRRPQGRARGVRADRPHRLDQRPRRHPRRSMASPTSMATSASCSPPRCVASPTSAPR